LESSGFDAAYSYFAANRFTEASTSQQWVAIYNQCKPLPFIPSVGPGYIDTGVRPWNGETTRLRNNGDYYKQMFKDLPKDNDMIVTITSFNEWHEGTQIEPAADINTSKMITYESYHKGPFTYIYLTRELIFAN
jgi:glycoprotein endo-alpha-1,2-mannosidase